MEKVTKILIVAGLTLVFLGSLVANGVSYYRSTNVALVVAQQQGYATCQNEVNQMITDGKLTVTTTQNETK